MELTINTEPIVKKGDITFSEYEELKVKAEKVAEIIDNMAIDEESIKQSKKTLSEAKKIVKALDDKRKQVKHVYLEPLTTFENQIKEIKGIIERAERHQRTMLAEIEKVDKIAKYMQLESIFDEAIGCYESIQGVVTFDKLFKNEYLNKTYSINKYKEGLYLQLEKIANDVELIAEIAPNDAAEIIDEYLGASNYDVRVAKMTVESRKKDVAEIKKKVQQQVESEYITIKLKKDDLLKLEVPYEVIG